MTLPAPLNLNDTARPWHWSYHDLPSSTEATYTPSQSGLYIVLYAHASAAGTAPLGSVAFIDGGTGATFWEAVNFDEEALIWSQEAQLYFPVPSSSTLQVFNAMPTTTCDVAMGGIFVADNDPS